jgi:hypothetical protein
MQPETAPQDESELAGAASDEVDVTLIDWYLSLSVTERLRAASKSAATLERLRRAASTDR